MARTQKLRKYGTRFYEKYAQLTLERVVDPRFAVLSNADRPDLQAPDHSEGIEVTRAMDGSRKVARDLLKEVSGLVPRLEDDPDYADALLSSGYGYAYKGRDYISFRDADYWSLALPLQRILRSKVSKVGNGFYGDFGRMGLFVFCMDPLSDEGAADVIRFVMSLQEGQARRYDTLYLSEVSYLHLCSLSEDVSPSGRLRTYDVPQDLRREIYLESVRSQLL